MDTGGLMQAIAADVSARGAGRAAAIRASFGARMDAARRGGGGGAAIAAVIAGLKRERQAQLKALRDELATERSGRLAAAMLRQERGGPRRPRGFERHDRGASSRVLPRERAATVKSFKAAAQAALVPVAPAAPRARRRRGSGGRGDFETAARRLMFRAPLLPVQAYGPAIGYLGDTLQWLNLWNDPMVDSPITMAENSITESFSLIL